MTFAPPTRHLPLTCALFAALLLAAPIAVTVAGSASAQTSRPSSASNTAPDAAPPAGGNPSAGGAPQAATGGGTAGPAVPTQAAWRRVTTSCHVEYERFCPGAASALAPTPREEAMCLKVYKTSLSRGCRGAIGAVTATR